LKLKPFKNQILFIFYDFPDRQDRGHFLFNKSDRMITRLWKFKKLFLYLGYLLFSIYLWISLVRQHRAEYINFPFYTITISSQSLFLFTHLCLSFLSWLDCSAHGSILWAYSVSSLNYFWLNSCSLVIHEIGSLIVLFVVQHFLMVEIFATTILLVLLLNFSSELHISKCSQ
jgi:hypothetical protein